ncbi:peptidylprolyl isomerase [Corallibacter sp.]|uniref:peptidylprolyl isomerase n=1 Tax=Corallibacter sp. TaxID=2038084 RepID=UPI003A923C53
MRLFILFFVLSTSFIQSQNASKELDAITDASQAETYISEKGSKKNKLITFNEAKHKTRLAQELLKKRVGGKTNVETDFEHVHYKVVEKYNVSHYRVSYILLNGKGKTQDEINDIRDQIIGKYKKKLFSFAQLAEQYSISRNATRGGDTGWFTEGRLSATLENAIINDTHALNDIFKIDDVEKDSYYIVLKTHEPENIKEIKVLKVVEPK